LNLSFLAEVKTLMPPIWPEKAKKASYKCQLKMPSMTVSHKTHAAQWRHGKMTEFHVSLWILPELTTKTLTNRANKP